MKIYFFLGKRLDLLCYMTFLWSHCKFNSLSCFNECETFLKILNSVQSMDCDLRIQSNCNSLVDIFLRFTTLDRYLKKVYGLIEEPNHYVIQICAVCRSVVTLVFCNLINLNEYLILMVAIKYLFMHLLQLIYYYPDYLDFYLFNNCSKVNTRSLFWTLLA